MSDQSSYPTTTCASCGKVTHKRDIREDFTENTEAYARLSKLVCPLCKGMFYRDTPTTPEEEGE